MSAARWPLGIQRTYLLEDDAGVRRAVSSFLRCDTVAEAQRLWPVQGRRRWAPPEAVETRLETVGFRPLEVAIHYGPRGACERLRQLGHYEEANAIEAALLRRRPASR